MRTSSTFSVLFWIYTQRAKGGEAPIYVRISLNNKKLNISLKRKIGIELWDSKKQRSTGVDAFSLELNEFLDQEYSRLFQYYQELRIEGRVRSLENIKKKYFGESEKLYSLEDIFEYHNTTCFSKLKPNTRRLYDTSQNYIRKFIKQEFGRKDYYLQELDYNFVLKFENFLRTVKPKHYQKNLQHNAVMKHIQRLKKMISLAYRMEWIDKNPFLKFHSTLEPREREFLSAEDLFKIENKNLKLERLDRVRDLFIFSCYTGISYGDLVLLKPENLTIGINGKLWIVTRRMKNGNSVKVPLLNKAVTIIEKYKKDLSCQVTGTLLPKISNQKVNQYLKEIATICEVKKHVTFHLARHTFATTVALSNGMPIETVSKLLGHKKLSTTQIYAKVVERKLSDDMDLLEQKINLDLRRIETEEF
ncbi:MAG: site-specific integrase [Candidatus Bathyarchaeota archaeon]|nr:site-specific integrase [Candidatus Bathyarchaeota archaeon]